jgi:predicted Holliday junction resolvase-like endonuclease
MPLVVSVSIAFFALMGLQILFTYFKIKKYKQKAKTAQSNFQRVLSQKKSSEVRVGKIGENMAPFLTDWPYNPNDFRFLGNPVDGIQFTPEEIIFIEIKTGKSRLTKSQRRARALVNAGKVSFATFRINEHGAAFVKDEIDEDGEN